jgi:hypothetical protein
MRQGSPRVRFTAHKFTARNLAVRPPAALDPRRGRAALQRRVRRRVRRRESRGLQPLRPSRKAR